MYRRKTRVDLLPGDLSDLRIEYLFLEHRVSSNVN